jgi:8-oxo-dGTP pyrophosphatase MutT (NUDIX family)
MIFLTPPHDFIPKFSIIMCICEYHDKILLLHRQKGKPQELTWGVPAGKVERDELPLTAAQRELFEETGIQVSQENFKYLLKIYDRYPTTDFGIDMFKLKLENQPAITINPREHITYTWVTLTQVQKLDVIPDLNHALKLVYPTQFS